MEHQWSNTRFKQTTSTVMSHGNMASWSQTCPAVLIQLIKQLSMFVRLLFWNFQHCLPLLSVLHTIFYRVTGQIFDQIWYLIFTYLIFGPVVVWLRSTAHSNFPCGQEVKGPDFCSRLLSYICDTTGYIQGDLGTISSCVRGDQNRCFRPGHDDFLTITKWFLCLNLTKQ